MRTQKSYAAFKAHQQQQQQQQQQSPTQEQEQTSTSRSQKLDTVSDLFSNAVPQGTTLETVSDLFSVAKPEDQSPDIETHKAFELYQQQRQQPPSATVIPTMEYDDVSDLFSDKEEKQQQQHGGGNLSRKILTKFSKRNHQGEEGVITSVHRHKQNGNIVETTVVQPPPKTSHTQLLDQEGNVIGEKSTMTQGSFTSVVMSPQQHQTLPPITGKLMSDVTPVSPQMIKIGRTQ